MDPKGSAFGGVEGQSSSPYFLRTIALLAGAHMTNRPVALYVPSSYAISAQEECLSWLGK
jgi:hypothetical protein